MGRTLLRHAGHCPPGPGSILLLIFFYYFSVSFFMSTSFLSFLIEFCRLFLFCSPGNPVPFPQAGHAHVCVAMCLVHAGGAVRGTSTAHTWRIGAHA